MDAARETLPAHVRYGKWAGLYGAVLALIAHQQITSSWMQVRCPPSPPALVLTTAIICGFIAIATGVWSWSVRQSLRRDPDAHATMKADRFIASISAAFAVVSVLFIVFSSVAVLFLRCER
jgi:hypothetical protein